VAAIVASWLLVEARALAGEAAPPPQEPKPLSWYEQVKNPTDWLQFGGDERLRHTYLKNEFDFDNDGRDNRNFFRIRTRVWAKAGPFFRDPALNVPNGLTLYTRLTYEPRYVTQWNGHVDQPLWDELIVDNLYLDWQRINGLPFSLKIGRQDLFYGDLAKGRGLVLVDPSVHEGSRTLYSDAIKATFHIDDWKANLDLFAMNNRGDQHRLWRLDGPSHYSRPDSRFLDDNYVLEYTQTIYGLYFKSKHFDGHDIGAYYIFKDEDRERAANPALPERMVHTVGIPVEGHLTEQVDYYGECAYQWGTEGGARRRSYALSSDLGYTATACPWTPRFHAGYEYLSGDDPGTGRFEGWDPVMSRWPQWSELLGYRWAVETGGLPFYYTNLQRLTAGISLKPTRKLGIQLDHSLLIANEHTNGRAGRYSSGDTRGQLSVLVLTYAFTKSVAGHFWVERFHPGSYYSDAMDSSALFVRGQLAFKF